MPFSFLIFSPEGRYLAHYGTSQIAVHGINSHGFIFLNHDTEIVKWVLGEKRSRHLGRRVDRVGYDYLWKCGDNLVDPKTVGWISTDKFPSLYELKAFAESEQGLTLILEDERFVFLECMK